MQKVRRFNKILVFLALLGLYTQIPLNIGNESFPNILGGVAGALLIITHFRSVRWQHVGLILLILLVAVFSIIIAGNYRLYLFDHIKAVTLLSISLFMGYGLYLGLRDYSAENIRKLFLIFCGAIIFGSMLEVFTPLNGLFTQIATEFWGYNLTKNALRDLSIAGFVRPTFLTSEPSHVAKGIVIFSVGAALVRPTFKGAVAPLVLVSASMLIVGSPSVLIAIPMILSAVVLASGKASEGRGPSRKVLTIAALGLVLGVPLLFAALSVFSERLAMVQSGSDTSTLIRLFGGLEIGVRAAIAHPVAGVGLGGIAAAEDIIVMSLVESGVAYSVISSGWEDEINNAIGAHLLQFGFVMLIAYIAVWTRLISSISNGGVRVVIALIFFISFALGDVYSPRFIIYIFFFCAAVSLHNDKAVARAVAKHASKLARGQS